MKKIYEQLCRWMKEKNIHALLSSWKTLKMLIPTCCLGILVITGLFGYEKPEANQSEVSASEISEILQKLLAQNDGVEETAENTGTQTKGSFDLEDGVYRGTGVGYGGDIIADVTIEEKQITIIDIVSAEGETEAYFERAKGVVDSIISVQSTEVDVISGATYSSNGIIDAVENALYGTESDGTTATNLLSDTASAVETVDESDVKYKDGTYTGSAQGFGGQIKVQVTIKNGKISKIKVLSASGETESYFAKAKTVLDRIVAQQSTNVDVVSGATYSSNGLIKAVRNALSKAKVSNSNSKNNKKNNKSSNKSDSETTETITDTGGTVPYDDGVYYGSGDGFSGTITVAVTIKDHRITSIDVVESQDDASFFNKAKELLTVIIAQQNTEVDVVSGATYSSQGLIEAVKNALKEAEKVTAGSTDDGTTSAAESTGSTESEGVYYNNGTYSVSVVCAPGANADFFAYTIQMDVTISGDKITAIENITGTGDDMENNIAYLNRASNQLVRKIIKQGNTDGIDAISGATYSSYAIIEGCQMAFEMAKK